ncbi:MAG: hypothetical protein ABL308_06400 [Oceanicaulis sp.]
MTDPKRSPTPPRAGLTLAAFLAVGAIVWVLVSLISGDLWLGFAYGLAPGLGLGLLAALRLRRGGLIRRPNRPDSSDRERA